MWASSACAVAAQAGAGVEDNGEVSEADHHCQALAGEAQPCRFCRLMCCLLRVRPAEEHQLGFHQIED